MVVDLLLLTAHQLEGVLAFERENREYFARTVSDRGDAYFADFAERFEALLTEQAEGISAFYVVLTGEGAVAGRFNLMDIHEEAPEVGFRVAEWAAGAGLATAGVWELCRLAGTRHGAESVRAAVADRNPVSARVLVKAGFRAGGPADPAHLGGKAGQWFERSLLR